MSATATLERPARRDTPIELAPELVAHYLHRLGVRAEAPSAAALARLHRAHVERVPYETFWIHLGEDVAIDPSLTARRIATSTRGGYCFHLNGAFASLLVSLGYEVTRHVAGVHDADGPAAATLANHVALIVHGLPSEDHPAGDWYVDAGLGDVLHDPLPLAPGHYRQGSQELVIEATAPGGVGDWQFVNDPRGSLSGVSIVADPVAMDVFADRHHFNRTAPTSSFRRAVTCQRRHATGTDVLRGRVLTRTDGASTSAHTIESQQELLAVLDDVFGVHLDVTEPALAALWSDMTARHEEWLAGQQAAA